MGTVTIPIQRSVPRQGVGRCARDTPDYRGGVSDPWLERPSTRVRSYPPQSYGPKSATFWQLGAPHHARVGSGKWQELRQDPGPSRPNHGVAAPGTARKTKACRAREHGEQLQLSGGGRFLSCREHGRPGCRVAGAHTRGLKQRFHRPVRSAHNCDGGEHADAPRLTPG